MKGSAHDEEYRPRRRGLLVVADPARRDRRAVVRANVGEVAQDQLVGHWRLVSISIGDAQPYGANPQGSMFLDAGGHYSVIVVTGGGASSISYFGTYTVDDADGSMTMHIDASSRAGAAGRDEKRLVTLSGDELIVENREAGPLPGLDQVDVDAGELKFLGSASTRLRRCAIPADSVAKRVGRIFVEVRLAADERSPADAGRDAPGPARPIARLEAAADDALLNPALARRKLSVRGEAGELRAGSGAARRAIVGAAGAKHEIAAVGVAGERRAEDFDMVDFLAVRPSDALRMKREPDVARRPGQDFDVARRAGDRARLPSGRTNCRPRRRRR